MRPKKTNGTNLRGGRAMIDREYDRFVLICDMCGNGAGKTFFEFEDALNHARLAGWQLQWGKGYWQNICPECQGW